MAARFFAIWVIPCLFLVRPLWGSQPTEEILGIIPEDAQLVLVVQNLRDVWKQAAAESLVARIDQTLLSHEFVKTSLLGQLKQGIAALATALGEDAGRLRDDVCGDSLVFVYGGSPTNLPRGEYGLLLTWCRDVRSAEKIRERIDSLQRKSGELRAVRRKPHGNGQFIERVKAQGDPEFLTLLGPILVLSNSEAALRETIDRRNERQNKSLRDLWKRVGRAEDFLTLWFNPRTFDSELMRRLQMAPKEEKRFLETFVSLWSAVDAVTLSLEWAQDKVISLAVACQQEKLPAAWRRLLEAQPKRSTKRINLEDWWVTIKAPVNLPAIRTVLETVLPTEAWAELSAAVDSALVPLFGRRHTREFLDKFSLPWTLFVSPPLAPDSIFADVALAIPLSESANAVFERQLRNAMDALTVVLRFRLGAGLEDAIEWGHRVGRNGAEIRFLQHDLLFPRGMQPAYSVQQRHLIWATNPKLIERLNLEDNDGNLDLHLVEARLDRLAAFLASRIDSWSGWFGKQSNDFAAPDLEVLRRWLPLMELFERAKLGWEVRNHDVRRISLRLVPAHMKP